MLQKDKEFAINGKQKKQCSRGDKCSFRYDGHERAKQTPKTTPPSVPPTRGGGSASRKKNFGGRSPSGKFDRQLCKNFLKGICTKSLCDCWHPPECQFYESESGCKFVDKCSFPQWEVQEQPNKRPKKGGDNSAVALLKDVRQLGCVFQDTEPPESLSILRKSQKVLAPIRRVRFARATQRHANIGENTGPSLGKIQVKVPARGDAWRFAQEHLEAQRTGQSNLFLTYQRMVFSSAIRNNNWRKESVL